MDRHQRPPAAVDTPIQIVDLDLTSREKFVGREIFLPLIASVCDAWQWFRRFVYQAADTGLIQGTRIELSLGFDSFEPRENRRPNSGIKLANRVPYRRCLKPADPNVHKMLVQTARPRCLAT